MSGGESRNIYAAITDQIIAAIEQGAGDFQMPWHRARGATARPWNVASGKRYQGINIVALWLAAEAYAHPHPIWGTYKQWQAKGAQVRRGERASLIVFYKMLEGVQEDPTTGETEARRVPMARASHVFNAAQVDGYVPPVLDEAAMQAAVIDPIEAADHVVRVSGAEIREGGDRAFYNPRDDFIGMPEPSRFFGTDTMTPTEAYYATKLHELTHWSGGAKRLNRDLSGRFGANAYAMEELVAELGASYLCADLGVTTSLRPDHAAYIQSWLKVMRGDNRAIFTAAARAQDAARYLMAFAPEALRARSGFMESEEGGPAGETPTPPQQRRIARPDGPQ